MTRPGPPVSPSIDYSFLPGEEHNPLMESTQHVDWGMILLGAARHMHADSDCLVTGNVAFAPDDGGPHTAPDIMVIPGRKGTEFGRYEPGPGDPLPSVCLEILSKSNTREQISQRVGRLLRLGVAEVYKLDPVRETVVRVTLGEGGELQEVNAVGDRSEGLRLSFVRIDGHLALCCPAGRVVRPGDDPFGWLAQEQARADAEASRAVIAEDRATVAEDRATVAEDRATVAEDRATVAEEQALTSHQKATAARQEAIAAADRVRSLEAEIVRLRSLLPPSGEGAPAVGP